MSKIISHTWFIVYIHISFLSTISDFLLFCLYIFHSILYILYYFCKLYSGAP